LSVVDTCIREEVQCNPLAAADPFRQLQRLRLTDFLASQDLRASMKFTNGLRSLRHGPADGWITHAGPSRFDVSRQLSCKTGIGFGGYD
jgi:hypothetical protein